MNKKTQQLPMQQFSRAFGNYYHKSSASMTSEYLSSARTQISNLKKSQHQLLSPQNSNKPLDQNSIRIKTSTQHIAFVSHHKKSLSSDIKKYNEPPLRAGRNEIVSASSPYPFLVIQKKARELKQLRKKHTLPTIQGDSTQSLITSKLPDNTPKCCITEIEEPLIIQQTAITKPEITIASTDQQIKIDEEINHPPTIPMISIKQPEDEVDSQKDEENDIIEEEEEVIHPNELSTSMQRTSVKLKFKNAVQQQVNTMFINKIPKSLFNVIISPEFTLKHEEERKLISDKFEAGNFILLKKQQFTHLEPKYTKCIKQKYQIKHQHKITNITNSQLSKLNITYKAFLRKIKMIINAQETSKEIEQPQQFSFLTKHKKGSTPSVNQINIDCIVSKDKDKEKDKFTITITNDKQENEILTFKRPQYVVQSDLILEEFQSPRPIKQFISRQKSASPSKKLAIKHSGSMYGTQQQITFRHSISQAIMKDEIVNTSSFRNNDVGNSNQQIQEESAKLDFNQEFSKANLYVRLFYQGILHKLPRKTTYTYLNLNEINEYFQSQQLLYKSTQIFQGKDQNFENLVPSFKSEIITKSFSVPLKIDLLQLNFESSYSQSSDNSSLSGSIDTLLEAPNERLPPERKESEELFIFNDDETKNYKQLQNGQLVPIKKARCHQHTKLDFRVIVSVLDQKTKNDLLTFLLTDQKNEQIIQTPQSTDTQAFLLLEKLSDSNDVRRMTVFETQYRYDRILIGRYIDNDQMIDFEHHDEKIDFIFEPLPEVEQLKQNDKKSPSLKLDLTLKKSINKNQTIVPPKLKSKQTNNSPDASASKFIGQFSNQLTSQLTNNNNTITQSTTQYLNKPTNQSQNSFRNTKKTYEKCKSNVDSEQSSPSQQSSLQKSDLDCSQNIQRFPTRKSQQYLDIQQDKIRTPHHQQKLIDKPTIIKSTPLTIEQNQSMYQSSLRMRSHAQECIKRQKMNQKNLVKVAIEDNNIVEFRENIMFMPDMYIENRFKNGESFLTLASKGGNKEIVQELLKKGADVNAQNDDGNTPLHLAFAYGHNQIADILIDHGANQHLINKEGKTAWTMAQ